jgi:hypothetical protein
VIAHDFRQKGRSGTGSRDTAQAGPPGLRGLRGVLRRVPAVARFVG